MYGSEKPKPFEYSSLVMGSKDIPTVAFPHKRTPSTANKCYPKKSDFISGKYKNKSNKVKTRNDRPDIFLEGEQMARFTTSWQKDVDLRYFQSLKDNHRKYTPNLNQKLQGLSNQPALRNNPAKTELDQQSQLSKTSQFQPSRVASNLLQQDQHRSSSHKQSHHRSNKRTYSTDRTRTAERDSAHLNKEIKLRIQQKIMHKTELHRQETEKAVQQFKRKQLFYMTQRDLSSIRAESFIVVEHPKAQIVTGYYYKRVVEIASLTKIMTFYCVIQLLAKYSLNAELISIKIDDRSAEMSGTSAQLYQGDRYTVKQLLYALMLPSGNDAAVALSRWGGTLLGEGAKEFIILMNRTAVEIGMRSTSFGNPHGLPHPHNGSTAEDLSLLVSRCLQFEIFREVVKCKQFRCWTENEGVKREVVWDNTNKLLRRPGFAGVKTGVTVAAGPCLASLFSLKGREFIVILLRTNKLSRRFKQTRWILSMCFRRLNYDGSLGPALRELAREDPELDSDNSQEQESFNFERNDLFELQRRRKILLNQL